MVINVVDVGVVTVRVHSDIGVSLKDEVGGLTDGTDGSGLTSLNTRTIKANKKKKKTLNVIKKYYNLENICLKEFKNMDRLL